MEWGGESSPHRFSAACWFEQLSAVWSKNVSRETFFAPIFLSFSVISVLAALIVGRTIQPKCWFSAQPIAFPGFHFALSTFSAGA